MYKKKPMKVSDLGRIMESLGKTLSLRRISIWATAYMSLLPI